MRPSIGQVVFALAAVVYASPSFLQQTPLNCTTNSNGALLVTRDCRDPDYDHPIIVNETEPTSPVPHRTIWGRFEGTSIDFKIFLTPKSQWEGRFFQLVYPSQNSTADDNAIVFGVESGGFTIQASGSTGYRADAALAKFSRKIAQSYYNVSADKIYGYIYGGSGGSFKTIGAAENTLNVWDGCVALIQATPVSIPYNWAIRAFGGLIMSNQSGALIEAVQPGSSVDSVEEVLGDLEYAIYEETKALGIPPRGWEDWESIVGNRTQQLQTMKDIAVPMIQSMDPTYADDFWTKEGYAGNDNSTLGERFRDALVSFASPIETATLGKDGLTSEFVLADVPRDDGETVGLGFSVIVNGTSQPFSGMLHVETKTVYILAGAANSTLEALVPGATIQVDNRWYLAIHTYHRHQVPSLDSGFYGFDYLRNENGEPLYPQRDILIAPLIAQSTAGGGNFSGNITMKAIVMDNLLDFDAFPWHADWFKSQVKKAKGDLQDHYRLYYSDNADHVMGKGKIGTPQTRRVVDFTGLYQQHLRDLSAWVEKGVNPPATTNYTVNQGQVEMPSSPVDRKGIQPLVQLLVGGCKKVHTVAGESVEFNITAQVPNAIGKLVRLEFDPLGTGKFTKKDMEVGVEVEAQLSYAYQTPGVYFAGVRVASHRQGNAETDIALAYNLDRVRVVVS